jgi:hypothetical protein
MRSNLVYLERLTVNAEVATVLGSIPASSNTVESEGVADEAVLNTVNRKKIKKFLCYLSVCYSTSSGERWEGEGVRRVVGAEENMSTVLDQKNYIEELNRHLK